MADFTSAGGFQRLPRLQMSEGIPIEDLVRKPESVEGFCKRYNNFHDRFIACGTYGSPKDIVELFKVYYATNHRYFQDIGKETK